MATKSGHFPQFAVVASEPLQELRGAVLAHAVE